MKTYLIRIDDNTKQRLEPYRVAPQKRSGKYSYNTTIKLLLSKVKEYEKLEPLLESLTKCTSH